MAFAIEIFCVLMTVAGLVYLLMALRGIYLFQRIKRAVSAETPTISLLKPMKGAEPGLHDALRTHAMQQYAGRYEIIFGVSSLDDPAAAEAEKLRAEFPQLAIRIVECPQRLGASGKVSNLVQMLPHALGEVIVVNDADIHVSPQYLSSLAAAFGPKTGMVTAPYFGLCAAPPTVWAKLEALGLSTEFFPSVTVARMMEGIRFALGSTLAMRRTALDAIGGFAPLLDYVADDYQLGKRIHEAGYGIELCDEVVATTVPRYNFHQFWAHQMRWVRTVQDARPAQFVGMATTYALPWAVFTCIASGGALWSFTLLSFTAFLRVAVALTGGVGVLRDGQVLRDLWLLPLHDFHGLLRWAWSYAGKTIEWRGETFRLEKGKLVP